MGVCADRLWPGSSGTTTHDIFHFHRKEKHWNLKSAISFLLFCIEIFHWFFSIPKPIRPSSKNSKAQISIANNEKSLFQASNKQNGGTRAVFEIEMCLCTQCFTLLTLFTEIFYLICKCSLRNVSVELKKTNFSPITNSHWNIHFIFLAIQVETVSIQSTIHTRCDTPTHTITVAIILPLKFVSISHV